MNYGAWGRVSSNVDWCERNYAQSYYVAEFWNTISNVPMILQGVIGLWKIWQYKNLLGARYCLSYLFLLLVGIGSFLFHMTLLYSFQLLDELPMILGSMIFLFVMLELKPEEDNSNGNHANYYPVETNYFALIGLTAYGILTCVVMAMFTHSPLPMNVSYSFLVVCLIYKAVMLCNRSKNKIAARYFRLSWKLYVSGAILWMFEKYLCGFFPLQVDQIFHAIWHVNAGSGTFIFVLWTSYIHALSINAEPTIKFMYGLFPYLKLNKSIRNLQDNDNKGE